MSNMNMNKQQKSHLYHNTTINATKSLQTTIALAGQKRRSEDVGEPQAVKRAFVPAQIQTSVEQTTINKGDFKRPTLPNKTHLINPNLTPLKTPLKAGEIHDIFERTHEYSQRKALALTPGPRENPLLALSHPAYGLPKQLIENFASLGIESIYPWQSECLLRSGALQGVQNLVYTAPTGGGKSLVADILMLKKVIQNPEKKALLVLPYVALVQEKLGWLRKVAHEIPRVSATATSPVVDTRPSNFRKVGNEDTVRVAGFFGGSKSKMSWNDMDIAANSLVNAAIEDASIGKLGVVVLDELHMLDDENRGYILELMATKLLSLEQDVQIIGMSATLNNADVLAEWLNNAKFYISRYKPVPVEEHLVFDNSVYPAASSHSFYTTATQLHSSQFQTQRSTQPKPQPSRSIYQSSENELSSPLINSVVALANETARAGYGALVFCSSRGGCERDALLISRVLPRPEEVSEGIMEMRIDLLHELRNTSTGLDQTLEQTVPLGAAFHHAGLTTEERDLIANAFDKGIIKVIVATCSLAAGINMPARRVILHGARMGAEFVGPSMLRQMRGRAGRKGKDEVGETYLCCQKSDLEAVAELMEAEIPNVESCLVPGKRGVKRALLEVICTKLATSDESIDDYMKKTLLYHSISRTELQTMVTTTMKELETDELIHRTSPEEFLPTLLGQAIVASSLTPDDGLFVHRELSRALQAFSMDVDMHILYLFTPIQSSSTTINWTIFRRELEKFPENYERVLSFIGLKRSIINKMAQGGTLPTTTPSDQETIRIYRRFYSALQLRDLVNEIPVYVVARKYDLPRGIVQNLAGTCVGFASGMIRFCERMGWDAMGAVLDRFSDRLRAGAKSDLLALAQVAYIKSRTARVFWENGFKTVGSLANASIEDIIPVLQMAQPKKLKTSTYDETKTKEKLRLKATIISQSANKVWEREMQAELDEMMEGDF